MATAHGIRDCEIAETPIAVLDFETTGLDPGMDRVVEVSVMRIDPGEEPRLVFDTLVNPMRRMGATEIHRITDGDVAKAPRFSDIAGELLGALNGCVVAAYNVYFDMRFLAFELQNVGINHRPPHFCVMYMRPMLGLGCRCRLDEACVLHGIEYEDCHVAASDVKATTKLLNFYIETARARNVRTFGDLARLKRYKFIDSFRNAPFPHPSTLRLPPFERPCSRSGHVHGPASILSAEASLPTGRRPKRLSPI